MGWAGPAQPTGPDSAQNCWADFGPVSFRAGSGPFEQKNSLKIISKKNVIFSKFITVF